MKITNKTQYDGRYLRRLFLECERHIFTTYLRHSESKYRVVTVKYHTHKNNHSVGGFAFYNSQTLTITLPRPRKELTLPMFVRSQRVAQVYLHEVGHNLGLRHKQMIPSSNIKVAWLPEETVPLKTVKEKPKQNIVEARAVKAQKKLEEWQGKVRRANKLVKKYQRKVRYYEKKMAATK